jgi:hypothetical protein
LTQKISSYSLQGTIITMIWTNYSMIIIEQPMLTALDTPQRSYID